MHLIILVLGFQFLIINTVVGKVTGWMMRRQAATEINKACDEAGLT
jgi:hypothetical protein